MDCPNTWSPPPTAADPGDPETLSPAATLLSLWRRSPNGGESRRNARGAVHRTNTGCRTCRSRKVKCGEQKPACDQCRKARRVCEWSDPGMKAARLPRRANLTACDACKEKKLKCVGDSMYACKRCIGIGIECLRSSQGDTPSVCRPPHPDVSITTPGSTTTVPSASNYPSSISLASGTDGDCRSPLNSHDRRARESSLPFPTEPGRSMPLGELPAGKELDDLIQLYFSSVHHFGYFAFIHRGAFNRLLEKGKLPRELTLMMIASALRFGAIPSTSNLRRADAYADAAIEATLPRVFQGFGAIQLMTLLLAQHYNLHRGNFTSAWLLGANCTRMMQMMSLQTFDRTYPASLASNLRLSPLLSPEALRRIAWATFYADSMVDGGRYGFHIVDESTYRLQLPCDEANFLSNATVVTEALLRDSIDISGPHIPSDFERAPLDMSAYLLRAAAARRRALHFAFRASHKEQTLEQQSAELVALEAHIEEVIRALPRPFHFNGDSKFLHRDRLSTFILLHVLHHNLFIVTSRAALQIYARDSTMANRIPQVRRKRVAHALPISGLISEGLKAGVVFDPHIGVQAYVALEILLFEPLRLAELDPVYDPKATELLDAMALLLTVIRDLASRSEIIHRLHIEAVYRLLKCDLLHLLNQADLAAFRSEYRLAGQDAAEYDFVDFRWAKLERIRQGGRSSPPLTRDEALLEFQGDTEEALDSTTSSPRLDAQDVENVDRQMLGHPPTSASPGSSSLPDMHLEPAVSLVAGSHQQPWWGLPKTKNVDEAFFLDWSSWLLSDTEQLFPPTGDDTSTSWSSLATPYPPSQI